MSQNHTTPTQRKIPLCTITMFDHDALVEISDTDLGSNPPGTDDPGIIKYELTSDTGIICVIVIPKNIRLHQIR